MFGRTTTNRVARIASRVAVVLAATGAATASFATPASAYTTSTTGYAGTVTVPVTDAKYVSYGNPQIIMNARSVGESKAYASYDQYVCVTNRLWIAVPTPNRQGRPYWQEMKKQPGCGWITANRTSINVNATVFGSEDIIPGKGYRTSVDVTWQLSNGAVIGTRNVGYSAKADFRCLSGNCGINPNWDGGYSVAFPNM